MSNNFKKVAVSYVSHCRSKNELYLSKITKQLSIYYITSLSRISYSFEWKEVWSILKAYDFQFALDDLVVSFINNSAYHFLKNRFCRTQGLVEQNVEFWVSIARKVQANSKAKAHGLSYHMYYVRMKKRGYCLKYYLLFKFSCFIEEQ